MKLLENQPLDALNTFGIKAAARYFTSIASVEDLLEAREHPELARLPWLLLGGGSNLLLTGDVNGLVAKVAIPGREVIREDEAHWFIRAGAGENWHEFVCWCIERGYAGIENLSLIPGCMGAAPIQNIGAYGVELKEVFEELEAVDLATGELRTFNTQDCGFGYRDSIFKNELKDKIVITSVTLRLNKKPAFNTSYGAVEQELEVMGVTELSIAAISEAVCCIRRSKLPDPAELGNAGSFFKNPVIPAAQFEDLKGHYPDIVGYPDKEGCTKVAAGWLLEKTGWKGRRFGSFGVHERQALVLVNYGGATGKEIFNLSKDIQKNIQDTFGIALEREVNVV